MTLYTIMTKAQLQEGSIDRSLSAACTARGISHKRLFTDEIVLDDIRHMDVEPGSLVYRMSTNKKGQAVEAFMDAFHGDRLTSIYYPKAVTYPWNILLELTSSIKHGYDIIPTLVVDQTWRAMDAATLTTRLAEVGGFPVIVKTLGYSHGQGVRLVQDAAELQAAIENVPQDKFNTIIRRYLADYRHYRLIVVAGEVVAAVEYHKPDDDFRTNASNDIKVTALDIDTIPQDAIELALRCVELRKSLLGGVDILIDMQDNKPYLAEVNVPCYFVRAEAPTGVDIAGILVDAMVTKSQERKL